MQHKPVFLVVSGIDGSGKTTVIEGVIAAFEARGLKCHYSWMRYTHLFVKPLHALARVLGLTRKYQTPAGTLSKHEFYRVAPLAPLYARLTLADTWLGRLRLDRRLEDRGVNVVICDRWANDIVIDMAVDFRNPSLMHGRSSALIRAQMPPDAVEVVILRDRAAILESRPENAHDPDFDLRLSLYRSLPDTVARISNDGSVFEAVQTILNKVIPRLTESNKALPEMGSLRK